MFQGYDLRIRSQVVRCKASLWAQMTAVRVYDATHVIDTAALHQIDPGDALTRTTLTQGRCELMRRGNVARKNEPFVPEVSRVFPLVQLPSPPAAGRPSRLRPILFDKISLKVRPSSNGFPARVRETCVNYVCWTFGVKITQDGKRFRRNATPTFVVREGSPLRSSRLSQRRSSPSLAGCDSQLSPPGCVVAVSRALRQSQARHQPRRSERAGAGGRECFATPICW